MSNEEPPIYKKPKTQPPISILDIEFNNFKFDVEITTSKMQAVINKEWRPDNELD